MWSCQVLSVLGHLLLIGIGGFFLGESARFGMELGTSDPGTGAPSTLFAEVEAEPLPLESDPEPEPEPEIEMVQIEPDPDIIEPLPPPPPQPEPRPPRPVPPRPAAPVASTQPGGSPGTPGSGPAGVRTASRADYLRNPPPPYPPDAKRRQEQGTVTLLVEVNADGRAAQVTIRTSSGPPLLESSARSAVAQWRFQPATVGGIRVSSQVIVPIRFELDSPRR